MNHGTGKENVAQSNGDSTNAKEQTTTIQFIAIFTYVIVYTFFMLWHAFMMTRTPATFPSLGLFDEITDLILWSLVMLSLMCAKLSMTFAAPFVSPDQHDGLLIAEILCLIISVGLLAWPFWENKLTGTMIFLCFTLVTMITTFHFYRLAFYFLIPVGLWATFALLHDLSIY